MMQPGNNRTGRSFFTTLLLNAIVWFALQVTISNLITRFPLLFFKPDYWLFRTRPWEKNGDFYERVVRIKKWKNLLPDGAVLIKGGFPKKHLQSRDPGYIEQFSQDTCRAELVHWITIMTAALFFLWNTPLGTGINFLYALLGNIPCIAAQRYNRPHLQQITRKRLEKQAQRGTS